METLFFIGFIFLIGFVKTISIKKGYKIDDIDKQKFSSDLITDKIIGVIK
jgi:hypothetical protein